MANAELKSQEEQEIGELKQEEVEILPVEVTLGPINSNGLFLFEFNQKLVVPAGAKRNATR